MASFVPKKPCSWPDCKVLVELGTARFPRHTAPRQAFRQLEDRPTAAQRGYGSKWQIAREEFLRVHPTCAKCACRATVVDHIIPHRGDQALFWNRSNWQGLCKRHHDMKTNSQDGGFGNRIRKAV